MKRTLLFPVLLLVASSVVAQTQTRLTDATAEVGFSPGSSGLSIVLEAIRDSHSTIHIAAYELTNWTIADALIAAERRGVAIAVVADATTGHEKWSEDQYLSEHGVAVRFDRHYRIMHQKFMVIDGNAVETGSFNYTESAVKHNSENVLLLRNVPHLAAAYEEEWERLWSESH